MADTPDVKEALNALYDAAAYRESLPALLRSRNGSSDGFGLGPVCDSAANEIEALRSQLDALTAERAAVPAATQLQEMTERKDAAYLERNQVVAALAKCFPSGVARTAIEGWSEDWHGCVYIDLPTGQVSWHFHDSHAHLFADLPPYKGQWDGHDTPEKYRRLAAVPASVAPQIRELLQELLNAQEDYARCHMAEENAIRNYSGDQGAYSRATIKATGRVSKAEKAARAALAAPVSPPGWKLVPVEPTPDMVQAMENRMYEGADYIAENSITYAIWVAVYKAMLAAAPVSCHPTDPS